MMGFNSISIEFIQNNTRHYNPKKYWKMRQEVVNPHSKLPKLLKVFYFWRIKRMDAFNNASMGTSLGRGAYFAEPPDLTHGLNGIVIHYAASVGRKCRIYQQVTIAGENGKAATIGDNCLIGAGAKIIGNVRIGDNVKIGANCVVVKDVPNNCTVVGVPARIIKKEGQKQKVN